MKFRRQGAYKKNRDRAMRRHFKSAATYTGSIATTNGRVGFIDQLTIYVSNRMAHRDKRTFRRHRRQQGRIARATKNKLIDNAKMEI